MTSQPSFLPALYFVKARRRIHPHQVSEAAHQLITLAYPIQKEEKRSAKPRQLGREKVARSNPVSEK